MDHIGQANRSIEDDSKNVTAGVKDAVGIVVGFTVLKLNYPEVTSTILKLKLLKCSQASPQRCPLASST